MKPGRFKQPIWLVPLAIAALVAVFGWWGNLRLRHTIEQQLRAQLTATLNANVTALEIWMEDQKKLAGEMAEERAVRNAAIGIFERHLELGSNVRLPADYTNLLQFNSYLRPRLNAVGYRVGQLVTTNFSVIASTSSAPRGSGFPQPVSEAQTNKFAQMFAEARPAPLIITPYKPEPFRGRRGGGGGRGLAGGGGQRQRGTNDNPRGGPRQNGFDANRGRRGDETLMQVAAPVHGNNGEVLGALALIIDPNLEFTKILTVAQTGQSGETYAFDQTGLLLSQSRFDEELHKAGLLDATNASSAVNLRLHDPKAAPVDGTRPLTHIVAEAVAGDDGVDVQPSRDYRGVEVVGAWRWLPEKGFGVATQMDADEAYQPLRVLKLLFTLLCLLLLLCATSMFVFSYSNFAWRRRLGEAELKLKQLGQYTLEEKIGEGGMGAVYRARHAMMRRDTAIKLLLPDRADAAAIERFQREVCLTCQLTHPNTIQVFDYGHTPDGIFYYAMEFLRGLNLHELIARYGPQPEARVVHILVEICDSLAEAHSLGLVHRDIKPGNVFLCTRGGVPDCIKVLDFGLVREYNSTKPDKVETITGKGLEGTPWFMPPEAIRDSRLSDPRSDIYSLGALGYYLLTGEYVFDGATVAELCERHTKETPIPAGQRGKNPVSPELDAILMRCLEKDPAQRPQSAIELRDLLLASRHAEEWDGAARVAWWEKYESERSPKPGETEHEKDTPDETKMKIDFESRM